MTILSTLAKNWKWGLEGPRLTKISFELLIRTDYPQHTYQNPKMRSGRLKAHQADLWHTFLIKLLIKNCNPQHPCQDPKMRPGRPKAYQNELGDIFLTKPLIRNGYPQHPCPNPKMKPGRPKAHQSEFWDTFLIKLLIRNTISSTLAKPENEAWTAQGSPNWVLGHVLSYIFFYNRALFILF